MSQGILGHMEYQKNRLGEHFKPIEKKFKFFTFLPKMASKTPKMALKGPKMRLFGEPRHIGVYGVSKEPSWGAL